MLTIYKLNSVAKFPSMRGRHDDAGSCFFLPLGKKEFWVAYDLIRSLMILKRPAIYLCGISDAQPFLVIDIILITIFVRAAISGSMVFRYVLDAYANKPGYHYRTCTTHLPISMKIDSTDDDRPVFKMVKIGQNCKKTQIMAKMTPNFVFWPFFDHFWPSQFFFLMWYESGIIF